MFERFRKPTLKKHAHLLNLTPLESRDVPALWHITMVSSNTGDTAATITGSLYVGSADIEASGSFARGRCDGDLRGPNAHLSLWGEFRLWRARAISNCC